MSIYHLFLKEIRGTFFDIINETKNVFSKSKFNKILKYLKKPYYLNNYNLQS